jgi:hypothetical protein
MVHQTWPAGLPTPALDQSYSMELSVMMEVVYICASHSSHWLLIHWESLFILFNIEQLKFEQPYVISG